MFFQIYVFVATFSFQSWIELIDGTKEDLTFMSQWAIQGDGNGQKIFDHLNKCKDYFSFQTFFIVIITTL
jgi:hypothetical protein